MKRLLPALAIVVIALSAAPSPDAAADLANPDFSTKQCKPGEQEVTATYRSDTPFGPHVDDQTKQYANNPDYYELVAEGHSFGGRVKYCRRDVRSDTARTVVMYAAIVEAAALAAVGGLYLVRRRAARK